MSRLILSLGVLVFGLYAGNELVQSFVRSLSYLPLP